MLATLTNQETITEERQNDIEENCPVDAKGKAAFIGEKCHQAFEILAEPERKIEDNKLSTKSKFILIFQNPDCFIVIFGIRSR